MEQNKLDLGLLGLGLLIVCGPMALAHFDPTTYASSGDAVRMLTALGGGLIGTAIPGLLQVEVKAFRAAGPIAFVLLFYLYKPNSASESDKPAEAKAEPAEKATQAPPAQTSAPRQADALPHDKVDLANAKFEKSPVLVGSNNTQTVTYDEHKNPAPSSSK